MKKQEFLRQVKNTIDSGKIVRVFKGPRTHGLTLWVNAEKPQYIHYQSFGQSAVKNNLKDLEWAIYNLYGNSDIVNDYLMPNVKYEYTFKVVNGVYSD